MGKIMIGLVEQALTPEVFCKLRAGVQFHPYSKEDAAFALENTLYTVEARTADETIGMARVVGDGRIAFFIKDVVVMPDFQGCGVGRLLLKSVMRYIAFQACEDAYVGLMTSPGTEAFYEKFGFISRPAPGLGHGMVQFIRPDAWLRDLEALEVSSARKVGNL